MMTSASVRDALVDALHTDLVGPVEGGELAGERLELAPSRWYLTGFLVPARASVEAREDPEHNEGDMDDGPDTSGNATDASDGETRTASRRFFPSSIGLSVLVPEGTQALDVSVSWGDYERVETATENNRLSVTWQRCSQVASLRVPVQPQMPLPIPGGRGLLLHVVDREVPRIDGHVLVPAGTRALSLFVVNEREVSEDVPERRDEGFAFQVQLRVACAEGFIPRPDLHGHRSRDPDERIADLQFRDVHEFAVGHGASAVAHLVDGRCTRVETAWVPSASVNRVDAASASDLGVDPGALRLDVLARATDSGALQASLRPLVAAWRSFLDAQASTAGLSPERAEVAATLVHEARVAARRVEDGIQALADPVAFTCFTTMNKVVAAAMRQRDATYADEGAGSANVPTWRPFQLAFILLNLRGVVEPTHADRRRVDLLYFPTGGGKTEAYLGLAAFTMLLRRRRNPGMSGGGNSVLMRYTLRLLTLDQLERATTLICAMELERRADPTQWGAWPFEIGLWVGSAATPNHIGDPKNPSPESAIGRVRQYITTKGAGERPVPVERCPWCLATLVRDGGEPFTVTDEGKPTARLRVKCVRAGAMRAGKGPCPFSREGAAKKLGPGTLPMCLTDEEVYRRAPGFLIATVDKFANLPWVGESGAILGKITHATAEGYLTASEKKVNGEKVSVPPPDLVIQDELHLISGPLGTMVGLYEAAFDALMERDGVRPKVIASTATVRRAEAQTRALFCREGTTIFPPPMPDRRDLFFARTLRDEGSARRYVGIAGQGRSHKVVMLRVYLSLLGAAKKHWDALGGAVAGNPADPYMTLLGYFNSLKELGNARRIVEDEVISRVRAYGERKRLDAPSGDFASRTLRYEVEELTSRESTARVAQSKAALALPHWFKPQDGDLLPVDVALATNMISVGLDITRLGLMVVCGQPKATAEYIQTTSRVGRDKDRPGLVVTLLNIHRPRDRSHYERFGVFHEAFYRAVEATSVTPFSPRALDRGLAGVTVALARHTRDSLTPAKAVSKILTEPGIADLVAGVLDKRERDHIAETVSPRAGARARDLIDVWVRVVKSHLGQSELQYGREPDGGKVKSLLRDPLEPVEEPFDRFRARRSLRDVEAMANVWVQPLGWDRSSGDGSVEADAKETT